ncbi:MAG: iron(III) transport system ATP-binding protein [Halobacteriales archaeon]|jgi:iron(III) transport system ATP-binding protein
MSDSDVDAAGSRATTARHAASPAPDETILELDRVSKRFGSESAVEDLSLSVREGEILTLLGPSGCGKTTTLRLVAGLERPDDGEVRLDGESVAGQGRYTAPETRDVGVVFQEFALFPHLTAEENVAFGLEDWPAAERKARVDELFDLVGLEAQRGAYPDELSGGQQQRVALARSLAPKPSILLLDEPFSNLDVDLRVEMREEVRRILKDAGVTAISVTHDQEEALSLSDRVAVMHEGAIEQVGPPERVFQEPESRFVAGFLGHASFLSGYVSDDVVHTAVGEVAVDLINGLTTEYEATRIDVLVRPDDVAARPVDRGDGRATRSDPDGEVIYRQYLGPTVLYRVELQSGDVVECMHNHTEQLPVGAPVDVEVTADHELAWFPKPAEE